MKRLLTAVLLLGSAAFPQDFKLGSQVSDFTISDLDGKPVQWSTIKGDITVVMFVATQCPVSNAYNERMNAVYNDYFPKGVKFVAINANSSEPAEEVREHARQNKFPFAVYKDAGNVVADRFNAQVTPEVFLIDRNGTIRYHGYIDDSRNPARIQKQGLRMALDAVLSNQTPPTTETKAFGCTIKRQKRT
ncbi:MAG TPA: redoxin domain-containing protein [Bryobacteraceae bacterium]|nr:redoxin domain-containing protein [Bryobacteraceae bacterium]